MPSLPFYSLGQSKYMCTRILQTHLELKQNFSDNKLIERENLWIKPHIRLVKLNPISVVPIFMINVPMCGLLHYNTSPNFRMTRVCEIPGWNHIRDSHTVLKPYNLTCWQLTPLHDTDVFAWISVVNLLVNENDFLVPVERHRILKYHDITLLALFHKYDTYQYQCWNIWSWWSL